MVTHSLNNALGMFSELYDAKVQCAYAVVNLFSVQACPS